MAKSLLKSSTRKKAPVARQSKLADEKYTGSEPIWTGSEKWSQEKLRTNWFQALYYYNYHFTVKDLRKFVSQYGTSKLKWTKQDVAAFNECSDAQIGITTCGIAKALMMGATEEKDSTFFATKLQGLLAYGHSEIALRVPVASNVVKMTIQDRMGEKLSDTIGDIEAWYDAFTGGGAMPDMLADFKARNMPQQFVNQIAEYYTPRMQELHDAKAKGADEQLKEGYRHVDKAQFKRIATFYTTLNDALETYGAVKKAVRKARVKKPMSKEKLVKNVRYCPQFAELNLVSVNPADIVGANTLWVFNTKTRKIGFIICDPTAGQLSVKGSTIIGFDPNKSISKTLRKPAEQLKSFAAAGKVALRSYMDGIKTTEVKHNGRLNADTILLKVVR